MKDNDLPTFTALIAAGHVKADDDLFALIQNLDRDQARSVARWLALATNGTVTLRFMTFGVDEAITTDPATIAVEQAAGKLGSIRRSG